MVGAMANVKKSKKDKSKVINIVPKQPISTTFKTVAREETLVSKNEDNKNLDSVDMKYNPKFTLKEGSPSKVIKWKLPEKEHQFHYRTDHVFQANVDMELAKIGDTGRTLALKKLYFDYKNQKTFKTGMKLTKETSVHRVS